MPEPAARVPLRTVAREWTRLGVTGFGGPPAHIALLRRLVVTRNSWLGPEQFEDAVAACNLLPGPASTQLTMLCGRIVAGPAGALVGGIAFIGPAVILMLGLSALFLAHAAPAWVRGAGAGAGAAVAAVAVHAGLGLARPSFERSRRGGARVRWFGYALAGALAAALAGEYLVLVLLAGGALELALGTTRAPRVTAVLPFGIATAAPGGIGALIWVALKVGALSFGGGFVIVPLMQHDAVSSYHWMTSTRFLSAVALGQATPGPVVASIAAVGYAARGAGGALLASLVAFAPSFAFVLLGGGRFERLRTNASARAFLRGAGPVAIGAILGAAVPLAGALAESWQVPVLVAAAVALLILRRGVVLTLIGAGVTGAVLGLAGTPLPH